MHCLYITTLWVQVRVITILSEMGEDKIILQSLQKTTVYYPWPYKKSIFTYLRYIVETRLANGHWVRRSTQFIEWDEIRYSHSGTAEGACLGKSQVGRPDLGLRSVDWNKCVIYKLPVDLLYMFHCFMLMLLALLHFHSSLNLLSYFEFL